MKHALSRSVRSKWNKALQELVLPANRPRTPELLLREYVQQVRGNRLVLLRDPLIASPGGPSGRWITSGSIDFVWVHPGATGVLERRIVAHEFGHMINGDEPEPITLRDIARLLQSVSTHTSPALWASSMCRTDFSDPREQQAEAFSYFTEEWLSRTLPPGSDLVGSMRESLDTRNEFR
ncbi:hypothetical protein [Streptomyces sp. NPDC088752]|uniref:hypothetical protein n=1 Tax=Streptomyces sp. NPDC088752 TaxID=3154963 RepID=UPI0034172588